MAWNDILKILATSAGGPPAALDGRRRWDPETSGSTPPFVGDYELGTISDPDEPGWVDVQGDVGFSQADTAVGDTRPVWEKYASNIPIPVPVPVPQYPSQVQARPVGNPTTAPGPAQTSSTTKAQPNSYRTAFDEAMANYQRLAAIDPNDKEVMKTYGHGKYAPGTMKRRNGVMTDVGGQTKEDGVWGNIGKGMLLAMKNIAPIMLDKNVSDKTALGYAIGAAAGGGVTNAFKGTMDEQARLEQDKARAMGNVQVAQGAYEADQKGRLNEANIEWANQKPQIELTKAKTGESNARAKLAKVAVDKLKVMVTAISSGVFDREQTPEFMDKMADLAGVDAVKIDGFDPNKDKIKNVNYNPTPNPDGTYGMVVTTVTSDGRTVTSVMRDETGKPISVTLDRIEAAKIAAAAGITRQRMGDDADMEQLIKKWELEAIDVQNKTEQDLASKLLGVEIVAKQLGLDAAWVADAQKRLSVAYRSNMKK